MKTCLMSFVVLFAAVNLSCQRQLSTVSKERVAPKVLMFIRAQPDSRLEFMLINEVDTMRSILQQSGFEVTIATISGDVIKTDSEFGGQHT